MKNIFAIFIFGVSLAGCGGLATMPITEATSTGLKGKSVISTNHPKPNFTAMTAGKAAFGMMGAAMMVSKGNAIVRNNNVEDPANQIALNLKKLLKNKYNVSLVNNNKVESDSSVGAITSNHSKADYILDVKTSNWNFSYFPGDWNNYRVVYNADFQLINVEKNKVISSGSCSIVPKKTKDSPSYDDLMKNNAEVLKNKLTLRGEECTRKFKSLLFN